MNIQAKITDTCKDLYDEIKPKAILHFGSTIDNTAWSESDIDLFLIINKSKEHSAFYFTREEVLYHCNVISEKGFKKYLQNPTRPVIQGLFVKCKVYFDSTNWIKKEKLRLKKYPRKYRVYRVIAKIEEVLAYIYKLRKYEYFNPCGIYLENPTHGLEKIFEMEAIDQGVYFGRSIFDRLKTSDKKIWKYMYKIKTKKHILLLQKRSDELVSKYLPLFIEEISRSGKKCFTYSTVYKLFGLDLEFVFKEAKLRGLVDLKDKTSSIHGFKIKEETVFI